MMLLSKIASKELITLIIFLDSNEEGAYIKR